MYAGQNDDEWDLRHYASVLWRRKLLVAGMIAVLVATALAWSLLQDPRYRATAEVLLQRNVGETILSPDPETGRVSNPSKSRVQTEIEVMQSRSVQRAVEAKLGRVPDVAVKQRGDTEVVAISAVDTVPERARAEAQTYAEVFIETRRQQLVAGLLDATQKVQAEIDPIRQQIAEAVRPLADLDARIAAASASFDSFTQRTLESQRQAMAADIERQVSGLRSRETAYATQLDQLELASNITRTGGVQVVSDAVVPEKPFAPKTAKNLAVAVALGIVLGVALAFVRDHFDDRVRSKADLDLAARGLPVLALVPGAGGRNSRTEPTVVSRTAPQSVAAEAYRTLRTSIHFVGLERPLKVLQVTSPNAGEGKTTTLANLAVSLARADSRVVIVDCDLRRPQVHVFFGIANVSGFTSVLLGEAGLAKALQRVPNETHLTVLPAGNPPPNPSELLSSRRTAELFEKLAAEFDYVLVDGPAVLPVTDSLVLSAKVDGVVVLATAKQTTQRSLNRALELLAQVEAPVVGTVLNMSKPEAEYAYPYGDARAHERRTGARWRSSRSGRDEHATANGRTAARDARVDTKA